MAKTIIPLALSYDDVLLVPHRSSLTSRSQVDLSTHLTPHIKLVIPLLSANMDTVTGVAMAIKLGQLGGLGILPRFNSETEQVSLVREVKKNKVLVGASVGVRPGFMTRVELLVKAKVDLLVLDVAHGHQDQVMVATRKIKSKFPQVDLVSGNVASYLGAKDLFQAGADCVKVGIGPGSTCTTRITTGFGVPQITAVMEAAKAAREAKKTLICDGGTKNSADIVKGLAAGSHAIMLGSLLAGTDEAPGETILHEGVYYKRYNGSTSIEEKRKHAETLGGVSATYLDHIEGVSALVPFRGPLKAVVSQLTSGMRSGFSYAGAKNLVQLHERAQFVQVTPQGNHESAPHDVILT